MHSHIYQNQKDKQKEYLRRYLPRLYTEKVLERAGLEDTEENVHLVRQVRHGRKINKELLKIIFEVEEENKKIDEEIMEIVNN